MKRLITPVLILLLVIANLAVVHRTLAHPEGHHWPVYGTNATIRVYDTTNANANTIAGARDARNEWSTDTILNLPVQSTHTDIHVFDLNSSRNIFGLMEPTYSTTTVSHFVHAHAWYNERYAGEPAANIRLVFCQEIGHAFGLAHSEPGTGGCMGSQNQFVEPHNIQDIDSMYRYVHPHGGP